MTYQRYNSFIPKLLRVQAITLYPFILYAKPWAEVSEKLIKHEKAHVAQVERDGIFKFYSSYIWQYLKGLVRYRSHALAYTMISYEIEARKAEEG